MRLCCKREPPNLEKPDDDLPRLNQYDEPFLLVGVMTTRKYLKTRAAAISRTWGKHIPGKILFFLGQGREYRGHLPIVVLDKVSDNAYPPQKKSFAMLKYIHDNFIDSYEWFMRVDDDIFIQPDRLEKFLRSVNSSRRLYMGQPGLGIPRERGKLGLRNDSFFFCMGGTGIVFTRETLRRTALGFDTCLKHTFTKHEDTELGRCVNEQADVSCSAAYEFSAMFYQNRVNRNGSFEGEMDPKATKALTLHPVKKSEHVYRLGSQFSARRMFRLKKSISRLEDAIRDMDHLISQSMDKKSNIHVPKILHKRSIDQKKKNHGTDDIWNFIRSGLIYTRTHPYQNPYEIVARRGRQLRINATILALKTSKQKSNLPYFYYEKINPNVGVEHVMAMGNRSSYKPYVAIQRFQIPEVVEVLDDSKPRGVIIYMILPLYRRSMVFANFLTSLNTTAYNFHGKIHLRIVLYKDTGKEFLVSLKNYNAFNCSSESLKTELFLLADQYSRVKAMNKGLEDIPLDSLVLFMDVDMIFTASFLDRVILNTKRGKESFFPVSFSLYDPSKACHGKPGCHFETNNFQIHQDRGTWRHFGFRIVGIYKDDFIRVNGWDTSIMGRGKEDSLFYEQCFSYGFPVFRSIELGLVHVHHIKYCNSSLPTDQYNMCLASRAQMYASQSILANLAFSITSIKENM
ncbi:chondroitin sulfate synthase 1-like [Gigantopelta aegis]|uniref:chondroitin sulfate synthase 1-like n=1 Tax=Gigantopelta aegis TaxID=1735272 RepID=UPI001B88C5B7|nr:chondroitin sulfate synthase 1-like [Gigantopelta aegis]